MAVAWVFSFSRLVAGVNRPRRLYEPVDHAPALRPMPTARSLVAPAGLVH
ncbi:hypothetical protein SAMN04487925_106112 [Bradyrhizobium sp. cf659]|nr:hypothetical protein SAMN04487925_106112 [Bradyrhizobium sp. cf659]